MKKIISLVLLGATTSLMAIYAEHAYLYKDPRIMGMGGANIAVGGSASSVFSNPAGLANIKKEDGLEIDILSIGLSMSDETLDFINDIDGAKDEESDMAAVLEKYSGEHFHIGADNYSSVSKHSDYMAWSVGYLAAVDVNFLSHSNGSGVGGVLESSSRLYHGLILGFAKPYDTSIGRLDIGLGLKYITQTSYEGVLGITELIGDDIADKLKDKYEKKSTGYGADLGVVLHPSLYSDLGLNFAVGLSVLNIGDMDMDDNYGSQPTTVNIGMSISPEIPYLGKLIVAVDYLDLFNENKLRIYNYSDTDNISYTDYKDSNFMKRLRLGLGIGLVDTEYFSMEINTGLYQSAYTAGINMDMSIMKLNFTTYEEEVGVGSVNVTDRRYMVQLGLGW